MKLSIYKYFGILILILTFIVIVAGLFTHIKDIWIFINVYGEFTHIFGVTIKNIIFSSIVFVLGFFPGLFYYRYGKENNKPNKLILYSFILKSISFAVIFFAWVHYYLSCANRGCDPTSVSLGLLVYGIVAAIFYGMGILLILIYKFKTKIFKIRNTEKIAFLIAVVFMIILMIIAIGMTQYGKVSLSIEKCDKLESPQYRDSCHYHLSKKNPDLAICEKIQANLIRDICYKEKAEYYKDAAYCEKINFFKDSCFEVVN